VDSVIESIIRDNLVVPGTITSTGHLVNPPSNHIERNRIFRGIKDFSGAIFLSPSMGYATCSVYAKAAQYGGKSYHTVLECAVREGDYEEHDSTTPSYKALSIDPKCIEWRVTNPTKIRILSVLLVKHLGL